MGREENFYVRYLPSHLSHALSTASCLPSSGSDTRYLRFHHHPNFPTNLHFSHLSSVILLSLFLCPSAIASPLEARQSTDAATTAATASPATTSMPSGTDSNVVEEACYPTNSTGGRDPNAPCAQVAALVNICAYGNSSSTDLNVPESNPADQQKCFCGGPFWQYLDG